MNLEDILGQEIPLEASQNLLSSTTDRLTSSTGYLSLEDHVIFCTSNPARWTEISKILSDWRSFISVKPYASPIARSWFASLARNFVHMIDTIEADIVAIANAEYDLLQEPLFLEMSLLTVKTASGELTFEAGLFTVEQETELIDKFMGLSCTNRVVLAHHDGSTVRLFEGELKGVLCDPRGPVTPGLGWDRIFQPEGYKRTISEMSGYSFSVNVRNKPYLELGFFLRSHIYEGLFEVHITGCHQFHLQFCLRERRPRVTS
jgi:inosine/xanthosine triphosphate pyrophosphatase family protein